MFDNDQLLATVSANNDRSNPNNILKFNKLPNNMVCHTAASNLIQFSGGQIFSAAPSIQQLQLAGNCQLSGGRNTNYIPQDSISSNTFLIPIGSIAATAPSNGPNQNLILTTDTNLSTFQHQSQVPMLSTIANGSLILPKSEFDSHSMIASSQQSATPHQPIYLFQQMPSSTKVPTKKGSPDFRNAVTTNSIHAAPIGISSANSSSSSDVRSSQVDTGSKREMRLSKNREAARECRRKKKEYLRILEARVHTLEDQNRILIEELKKVKENNQCLQDELSRMKSQSPAAPEFHRSIVLHREGDEGICLSDELPTSNVELAQITWNQLPGGPASSKSPHSPLSLPQRPSSSD